MKASTLPGLRGKITNALALNREIARTIGFLQVYKSRSGQAPAAAADVVNLFTAAANAAAGRAAGTGVMVASGQQIPMTGAAGYTKATVTVVNGVITAVATA